MKKTKSIILLLFGIGGIAFVCTFDIIVGKPTNDITGPKSITGLIISSIFILIGLVSLIKK